MRDHSPAPCPALDRLETIAGRASARAWAARLAPSSDLLEAFVRDEAADLGLPDREVPAAINRAIELLCRRIGISDATAA